ncbi:hypothetical protein [Pseudomonas putida]|uniref:Uncharacterized protein n=1 Tax=Pseudomonas putida TaxID=303 RepID=A0A2C5VY62_PSEPU|nr:hypothetical protein [Pseudomonas putida]PHH38745.1 hypothetical protein CRX57_00665 [Pseudomonas putida]
MLQAATGKLFNEPHNPQVNKLRGVVYTNLDLGSVDKFCSAVGTLSSFDTVTMPHALCYELNEHIEGTPAAGLIASRMMGAYIDDFADVASFGLRAIFSPDVRITERLLHLRAHVGELHPSERLTRFYEPSLRANKGELEAFGEFTEQLIGLKRSSYQSVIKAIRSYVAAVHRMSDDLDLAYTLLVMSIESLAQDFDGYVVAWEDMPTEKREPVDKVLEGVKGTDAQAVRHAILKTEHLRLGHRFSKFIQEYLPADYYAELASKEKHPIGKRELLAALKNLYGTRSDYVHTLKPLTKEFLHFSGHAETYADQDKIMFTFQGLFRLVRAVIIEFVRRAEKITHEPCSYEYDNPSLLRISLDPSMWIYAPSGLTADTCPRFFEGLVTLLDKALAEFPDQPLRNLRPVVEAGFRIKDGLKKSPKMALLAFIYLKHYYLGIGQGESLLKKGDIALLNQPGLESLIGQALTGSDTEWPPSEHLKHLNSYYGQCFKPTGLKVPLRVEACMALALVERYRLAGQFQDAKGALAAAAEDFPRLPCMKEVQLDPDVPICWLDIIYPKRAPGKFSTLECHGL